MLVWIEITKKVKTCLISIKLENQLIDHQIKKNEIIALVWISFAWESLVWIDKNNFADKTLQKHTDPVLGCVIYLDYTQTWKVFYKIKLAGKKMKDFRQVDFEEAEGYKIK